MTIEHNANTLKALIKAVPELVQDALPAEQLKAAIERGAFRPQEDDQIGYWFSRFLTLRQELWEVIDEADDEVNVELAQISSKKEWQCFVIGFSAACLLVRLDRFLVFDFAAHTLIQRKLNEAFPEYRIERKQYSKIFSAYTDPATMLRLYDANKLISKKASDIRAMENDEVVGPIAKELPHLQSLLNTSKTSFIHRFIMFLSHKWRRRGASAKQKTMFAAFEVGGRVAAKMNPGKRKLVSPEILATVASELQPGDVMVSRHRFALTNFFLPGTWPHASLYVGTEAQREEFGIKVAPPIAHRWKGDRCTLEALRDGVLFRDLSETLSVDAYVVLRPNLSKDGIRQAIERVVKHEGKGYKFDFDFFNSDRLVCTEVVYRAFDGIEELQIPLTERAGRHTLTAEDLLDFGLDTEIFNLWSVFGFPSVENPGPHYGDDAETVLRDSYR